MLGRRLAGAAVASAAASVNAAIASASAQQEQQLVTVHGTSSDVLAARSQLLQQLQTLQVVRALIQLMLIPAVRFLMR